MIVADAMRLSPSSYLVLITVWLECLVLVIIWPLIVYEEERPSRAAAAPASLQDAKAGVVTTATVDAVGDAELTWGSTPLARREEILKTS
jgi:hypothetical protein